MADYLAVRRAEVQRSIVRPVVGLKQCHCCLEWHNAELFGWRTISGENHLFCPVCAYAYDNWLMFDGCYNVRYAREYDGGIRKHTYEVIPVLKGGVQ